MRNSLTWPSTSSTGPPSRSVAAVPATASNPTTLSCSPSPASPPGTPPTTPATIHGALPPALVAARGPRPGRDGVRRRAPRPPWRRPAAPADGNEVLVGLGELGAARRTPPVGGRQLPGPAVNLRTHRTIPAPSPCGRCGAGTGPAAWESARAAGSYVSGRVCRGSARLSLPPRPNASSAPTLGPELEERDGIRPAQSADLRCRVVLAFSGEGTSVWTQVTEWA